MCSITSEEKDASVRYTLVVRQLRKTTQRSLSQDLRQGVMSTFPLSFLSFEILFRSQCPPPVHYGRVGESDAYE